MKFKELTSLKVAKKDESLVNGGKDVDVAEECGEEAVRVLVNGNDGTGEIVEKLIS